MRIFKTPACRHAEHALSAARTQEELDVVRNSARIQLNPTEFGHFLKKLADRRQELADQWGREAAT